MSPAARRFGERAVRRRGTLLLALAAFAATFLPGCGPKPVFRGPHDSAEPPSIGPLAGPEEPHPAPPLGAIDDSTVFGERARVLEGLAEHWVGTPYRRGGRGEGGVDCSALAASVLGQLGVDLPRTTTAQRQVGLAISRDEIEPGDLLFFRLGSKRVNHVGVALDRERFLHASSSRGVVVERLEQRYFARCLVEVRRVCGL